MNQLFKYLLNSILAVLVFLLSVGVSYSTICCPKTDNQKSCCGVEKLICCSVEITDKCCYEEILEIQFDFETPKIEAQDAPDFLTFFSTKLHSHCSNFNQIQKIIWAHDLILPKKSSNQLSFLQSYLL